VRQVEAVLAAHGGRKRNHKLGLRRIVHRRTPHPKPAAHVVHQRRGGLKRVPRQGFRRFVPPEVPEYMAANPIADEDDYDGPFEIAGLLGSLLSPNRPELLRREQRPRGHCRATKERPPCAARGFTTT